MASTQQSMRRENETIRLVDDDEQATLGNGVSVDDHERDRERDDPIERYAKGYRNGYADGFKLAMELNNEGVQNVHVGRAD